jgi:hypothetical protein
LRVEGLGFRVEGLGFRVQGLGSRVQGAASRPARVPNFFFFFITLGLELSDTHVYEP